MDLLVLKFSHRVLCKLCPVAVAILNFRSTKKNNTKLCRGLFPHHSHQITVQLVKWFQGSSLKFQPIRTNNWPWRPCFKFDPPKIKTCRDPPKEYSCQVWFQMAQWFQRRRLKCLRRTPSYGNSSYDPSGQMT